MGKISLFSDNLPQEGSCSSFKRTQRVASFMQDYWKVKITQNTCV